MFGFIKLVSKKEKRLRALEIAVADLTVKLAKCQSRISYNESKDSLFVSNNIAEAKKLGVELYFNTDCKYVDEDLTAYTSAELIDMLICLKADKYDELSAKKKGKKSRSNKVR